MAYSTKELKEILAAERAVYELYSQQLLTSLTLHLISATAEVIATDRAAWIDDRALRLIEKWRSHFAPSRAGLPLESEWTP